MSASPSRPDAIELYLMHLNAALLNVPRAERDEFLREIRAHIFEKLEQPGAEIPDVLKALGEPEELARQFMAECSLTKSARSWSPWVLMRTSARWALTGFQGFAMFMVAIVGYVLAAGFYLTAVLKPIYPQNVGFFVSSHSLDLGGWPPPAGHQVLASYFIPIAMVVGFLIIAATTFILRLMMQSFAAARRRLA